MSAPKNYIENYAEKHPRIAAGTFFAAAFIACGGAAAVYLCHPNLNYDESLNRPADTSMQQSFYACGTCTMAKVFSPGH